MINWNSIHDKSKLDKYGWYVAALLPLNHSGLDEEDSTSLEGDNDWRKSYGFTKVWYNNGRFYEPSIHGQRSVDVTELVTHYGEVPDVPILEESHKINNNRIIFKRKSSEEVFSDFDRDKEKPIDFKDGFISCLRWLGIV